MELLTKEEDQIRKYLLGSSEPGEVEDLETRLLTDDSFLLEFCMLKDELVDDYVVGALSDDDTARFDAHFLSAPRRTRKLGFARALAVRAGANIPELPEPDLIPPIPVTARWQQYWPVAAALTVMLVAAFVAWKALQDHSQKPSVADQQRIQLESELARLNDSNSELPRDSIAMVTLKPVSVRGIGEDRRVLLKEGVPTVVLELELAGDVYESYRASLQTDEGVDIATIQNLKPTVDANGRVIRLKLPGKHLLARGYQIKLSGLAGSGSYEAAGLYPFQVVKD